MSNIKKCFTSRFGDDGYIVEADYSQLEIIALAELSKDPVLIDDIRSGVDLHRLRAAELFGIPQAEVRKEERTLAKSLSFQLQYGAGVNSMARDLDIPKRIAQNFVTNYYNRYRVVKQYQDSMQAHVGRMRQIGTSKTTKGFPRGESTISSPTGRLYHFKEYDAPEWLSAPTSFSPTEIKNYPVQGYATGDIVPFILGYLRKAVYAAGLEDKCLLINTVHDSIILDIHKDSLYTIAMLLKRVMESVPKLMKQLFDIDSELEFNIEVKYGKSWADQEVYNFK